MDSNAVECERGAGRARDGCACGAGTALAVLGDVQRAYEERLDLIDRVGGSKKLQMQAETLRSWVGDLVAQNALLARALLELEAEASARLLADRDKQAEMAQESRAEAAQLQRRLLRKEADLRGLLEVLRRLRERDSCSLDGIHFYDVTESDIFGAVAWRQKKQDHGDARRGVRRDTYKSKFKHYKSSY